MQCRKSASALDNSPTEASKKRRVRKITFSSFERTFTVLQSFSNDVARPSVCIYTTACLPILAITAPNMTEDVSSSNNNP